MLLELVFWYRTLCVVKFPQVEYLNIPKSDPPFRGVPALIPGRLDADVINKPAHQRSTITLSEPISSVAISQHAASPGPSPSQFPCPSPLPNPFPPPFQSSSPSPEPAQPIRPSSFPDISCTGAGSPRVSPRQNSQSFHSWGSPRTDYSSLRGGPASSHVPL